MYVNAVSWLLLHIIVCIQLSKIEMTINLIAKHFLPRFSVLITIQRQNVFELTRIRNRSTQK